MSSNCYSCHISMKLEFSPQTFEKSSKVIFHQSQSSGNQAVPCRQMAECMGMTKLTVAFHNFVNVPQK
jgi:hypothetical protein